MSDEQRRFEAMYGEHFDAVLRFVTARAEAEVAKDVTAETFLAAWRAFDRVPVEPRGWLLAVARRRLVDHYRSTGRRDVLASRLWAGGPTAVADHADGVTEHDRVRAAFATLRPADQELLRLLAWDGLTRVEAAQVLGCNPASFAVRLHRARHRFRAALDDPDRATTALTTPRLDTLEAQ